MKEPENKVDQLLQHRQFALDLARRLVGDPHGAEDLVQQAWLRAIQSPPREDRGLRGWVSRVVVNLARSRYRAIERHRRVERLAGAPEAVPIGRELEDADLRALLDRALGRIGEPQREAVRLRYYEGLPPREIARRLGVPLETVYTRLQRGLRELRRELGPRRADDRLSWCLVLLDLRARTRPRGGLRRLVGPAVAAAVAGAVLFLAEGLAPERGPSPEVAAHGRPPPRAEVALVEAALEGDRTPAPMGPAVADEAPPYSTAELDQPAAARGILLDTDEKPVADAPIYTAPAGAPELAREVARTAADGTFAVAVLEEEGWIGARVRGARSRLYYADDPMHVERGRIELRLVGSNQGPLAGRVLAEDGMPIAGARVTVPPDALPPARIVRDGCVQLPFVPEPVWTDAEGRFEIRGLFPGTQRIQVVAHGFAPKERPINLMGAKSGTDLGDVVLAPPSFAAPRYISGLARDGAGAPLADHVVQLCAVSDLVPPTPHAGFDVVHATRTDAAGRFELPAEIAAGRRIELLSAPARPGAARHVLDSALVRAGSIPAYLELRARPAPLGMLQGVAVGLPGQDFSRVRITLRSAGLAAAAVLEPDAATGKFELPDLPAGIVHVGVWVPGVYQPSVLVVDHRGPVTDVGVIRAEPTGSVRLDLAAAPEVDMQGLFVCLKFEHGNQIRIDASTSIEGAEIRDGAAWFPRVPPGKHRILVGGGTLGQIAVQIQVFSGEEAQAAVELVRGLPCRVSWPRDLEGRGFIAVRVADGVEVFRAPARPAPGMGCSKTVPLPPGRYVAGLERDGETLIEVPFRVDLASAPDGVDVRLDP